MWGEPERAVQLLTMYCKHAHNIVVTNLQDTSDTARVQLASRPGRGEGKSALGNTVSLAESALPEKVVIRYFQYTLLHLLAHV